MARKMVSFCQKRYVWGRNGKNGEKNGIIFVYNGIKNESSPETVKMAKKKGVFFHES